VLRQFLVSNEFFDLYSAFNRLDRNQDGFITPLDILNFFRDNGVTSVNEANCYFMIKYFDSDMDGKLHFSDFMQILLPCTNSKMRSEAS
jgi:Ca2+-binding EF-hand superfamily protein